MLNVESKFFKADKLTMHYKQLGQGDTNVVLLHGLGLNLNFWENNFEVLAKFFKVFALDLIGFGQSEKLATNYRVEDYADSIITFIKAENLKKVALIGHCFGSVVALKILHDVPELIDKLILITAPCFSRRIHWFLRCAALPVVSLLLSKPISKKQSANILKLNFYDRKKQYLSNQLLEKHYYYAKSKKSIQAFLKTVKGYVNLNGIRKEALSEAKDTIVDGKRILLIWGEDDKITPIIHAKCAIEQLPLINIEMIKKCGHMPQYEHSDKTNQLMIKFLLGYHFE